MKSLSKLTDLINETICDPDLENKIAHYPIDRISKKEKRLEKNLLDIQKGKKINKSRLFGLFESHYINGTLNEIKGTLDKPFLDYRGEAYLKSLNNIRKIQTLRKKIYNHLSTRSKVKYYLSQEINETASWYDMTVISFKDIPFFNLYIFLDCNKVMGVWKLHNNLKPYRKTLGSISDLPDNIKSSLTLIKLERR